MIRPGILRRLVVVSSDLLLFPSFVSLCLSSSSFVTIYLLKNLQTFKVFPGETQLELTESLCRSSFFFKSLCRSIFRFEHLALTPFLEFRSGSCRVLSIGFCADFVEKFLQKLLLNMTIAGSKNHLLMRHVKRSNYCCTY